MLKFFSCVAIFFLGPISFGQKLLGLPAYKTHVYINYENDLFAKTDRYYTQGVDLGINHFVAKGEFSAKLKRYELSQNVYTPSTIKSDSLLLNDRPYAAVLSGKYEWGMIRTSVFSYLLGSELGVVGPIAGGKEMQIGIHKATNNFLPLGWQHQINNGLIADVYAKLERPFIQVDSIFQMIAGFSARFGTFQTNASTSLLMILGNPKTTRLNLYFENTLTGAFYDGTLQGSLIGKKSEHVLLSNEIEHLIFKSELSIGIRMNKMILRLSATIQSRTFDYQLSNFHAWGGIRVIYCP